MALSFCRRVLHLFSAFSHQKLAKKGEFTEYYRLAYELIWVRKNSESEWGLPKRNGLVVKWNDVCGNIIS